MSKDEENIRLKCEQMALLTEVERLKEIFQNQTSLYAEADMKYNIRIKTLQLEIIDKEHSKREILDNVIKLEEALATKNT